MGKSINSNGFEYVDLGLPSGTLWVTMNTGASRPSDYGLYFSWGETKGYFQSQVGDGIEQKEFSWADYKWFYNFDVTKYKENNATLELEDDAAHVNMGGDWHMPTPDQCQELIDCTISEWAKKDGVNGRLFTSKKDKTKSIFIPASGQVIDGLIYDNDENSELGFIWSSTLDKDYIFGGITLGFNSYDMSVGDVGDDRCNGMCVRGVIG